MSTLSSEKLLLGRKAGRATPGKGFKAKVDGRWQDYSPHCNRLLLKTYAAGCPSMRLNVRGHMYKFDFESMLQKNLTTLETSEMRAPHDADRPVRRSLFKLENLRHPRKKGYQSLHQNVRPQRPIFVVRVPEGGPGNTIQVPHPKQLGKPFAVAVPADAEVGQPLYLPMPRTGIHSKVKYAAAGTLVGTTGTAVGVAIGEATGVAVAGGALASVGGVAALSLGGVAVVGAAVVAAGAGVHYATQNPGKAVAVGALTIGGLALADHIADVGVLQAAGDVAAGAGDMVEGGGELAEDAVDMLEDIEEAFHEGAECFSDAAEHGVDIVLDLF